jgi:chemotaxis protein CheX
VFVHGAARFFSKISPVQAQVGTPFLRDDTDRVMSDFSAVIGISGNQRGCVYYSAPREMVLALADLFGESDLSDDICADFVGEIANTISGNAREQLGPGFLISVPVVIRGRADDVRFPDDAPAFVIPISWNGHRSSLIICLKEEPRRRSPRAR